MKWLKARFGCGNSKESRVVEEECGQNHPAAVEGWWW